MSEPKFIIRTRYSATRYEYDEDGNPSAREEKGVGYLTNGGAVTRALRCAAKFDSEAEAWEYAAISDNIGSDEGGDFCWVETLP